MNLFVGNLSFESTGADVKKLFEGFGNVTSAAIVTRKEKRVPKSRGFGFVEMPDEQQALAAMAALDGKEFMGRVINVNPAHPKTEAGRKGESEKKMQPQVKVEAEQHSQEGGEQKKAWVSPVFNKPGTYRGGRRTRRYISRRGLAAVQEEAKPRQRSQDNPMRWRKRADQPKPWQGIPGKHKPWEKVEGGARPWKKAEDGSKPWRKSDGGIKPWKKPAGDAKPWRKSDGSIKPWKKRAGDTKPWSRGGGHPQKSGFNPSTSPGMVRGNGERGRTKGRRKPGGYKRRG